MRGTGTPSKRCRIEARTRHDEFRGRVLGEFARIPGYIQAGFLEEIDGCAARPQ